MGLYWTGSNDQYVNLYQYKVGGGSWTSISGSSRYTTTHTLTGLSSGARTVRLRARDTLGAYGFEASSTATLSASPPSKFNVSVVLAGGTTASAVTETNLNGAEVRMTPKTGFSWGTGADAGSDVSNFTLGGLAGASRSGELRPVCRAGSGASKAGCARPGSGSYTAPAWRGVRVSYNDVTSDQTLKISFTRASNVLVPAAPGWAEVKVHAQPQPTSVALTSTPASARGYDVGEKVRAGVTFSYPVAVSGTPRLALSLGGRTVYAAYESRSADKRTLTFGYTVVLDDEDGDGVGIGTGALGLNGGSIVRDGVAGSLAAVLVLPSALSDQPGHKVAAGRADHDHDGDGLIEVSTVAQLNAMRWDLDGDGELDSGGDNASYVAAFPLAVAGMGCPSSGCVGYELEADLNLDVAPYNTGLGWRPVGQSK